MMHLMTKITYATVRTLIVFPPELPITNIVSSPNELNKALAEFLTAIYSSTKEFNSLLFAFEFGTSKLSLHPSKPVLSFLTNLNALY